MKTGNELLATYYAKHKKFDVYGCWDSETPENEFEFYDIYEYSNKDKNALCVNEGEPFYEFPTRDDVIEFVWQLSK